MKQLKLKNHLDFLGISTSLICAIHCALLPFLISSFTFWSFLLTENIWFEMALIMCSLIFGALAFYKGCFTQHKRKFPMILFSFGFSLLLIHHITKAHALIFVPAA